MANNQDDPPQLVEPADTTGLGRNPRVEDGDVFYDCNEPSFLRVPSSRSLRSARTNSSYSSYGDSGSDADSDLEVERLFEKETSPSEHSNASSENDGAELKRSLTQIRKEHGLTEVLRLLGKTEDDQASVDRFPAWLLKDVLVQGYLLLTPRYLLFFAYIPTQGSEVLKAGALGKKRSMMLPPMKKPYKRYWVVLRRGSVSWYAKPGDVYFPLGVIPTRRILKVEIVAKAPQQIAVVTEHKTHYFSADSATYALEWAKEIRKEVFCVQNAGSDAVVRIPLKNLIRKCVVNAFDVARTLNFEVVLTQDVTLPLEKRVGVVSFSFFAHADALTKLVKKIEEYTDGYANMRGVQFDSTLRINPSASKLGDVDEDVIDTTPKQLSQSFGNSFALSRERSASTDTESTHNSLLSFSVGGLDLPKLPLLSKLHSRRSLREGSVLTAVAAAPLKLVNINSKVYNESEEHAVTEAKPSYAESVDEGYSDSDSDECDGDYAHNFLSRPLVGDFEQHFRDHFGLEPAARLLERFPTTLRKPGASVAWSGTLVVANLYICFQRENIQGGSWRMSVPLKDVTHIAPARDSGTVLELEVCESYYGVLRIGFEDSEQRGRAEARINLELEEVRAQSARAHRVAHDSRHRRIGVTDEEKYLEYSLLAARLTATAEYHGKSLRKSVPPLVFDPDNVELKQIMLQRPFKALKFAMLMIGSRGDVQPYIALAQGLIAEGHSCVILTHSEFKDWVESFGIEFREVGGDPRKLMELMVSYGSVSYGFIKEALKHFKNWLKELMRDSWHAMKHLEADVLIESPSSMIGIHIAEALSIPYFRAFTMPWTRTRTYPQALIMPDQKKDSSYNYLTYVMWDHLVWFAISKYVNHWRKHHLHIPPTDLDLLSQDDVPFLYCVSPSILVPPLDQPDWVHTCGYWNIKDDKDPDIDPDLVAFIAKARERKKPLAYVGFGSIIVTDPEAMTRTIVDATAEAGFYCVLARGWSGRSTKNDKKVEDHVKLDQEHIFEVDSVPHTWLFPQMDVCVHHGGCGTTGASLGAGCPTVIKPFFGDQYFYGNRVEDLNCGVYLKRLTKTGLKNALLECVNNKALIRQARTIGHQIQHEHGVEEGIIGLYDELDYARSVTLTRRRNTEEAARGVRYLPEALPFRNTIDRAVQPAKRLSVLWPSLPKFGRREAQNLNRENSGEDREVDVSV